MDEIVNRQVKESPKKIMKPIKENPEFSEIKKMKPLSPILPKGVTADALSRVAKKKYGDDTRGYGADQVIKDKEGSD